MWQTGISLAASPLVRSRIPPTTQAKTGMELFYLLWEVPRLVTYLLNERGTLKKLEEVSFFERLLLAQLCRDILRNNKVISFNAENKILLFIQRIWVYVYQL